MSEGGTQSSARERFLSRFGGVVEHSPWVAEAVWERYPAAARSREYEALFDSFGRVIRTAPHEQRLALLRAHPDLACGVVASHGLSESSRSEQAGAGLDQCTPQEFIEFQSLNLEYKSRLGFPFIIAVKGMTRKEILERFRDRVERSQEDEFATATENVIRIIGFRIADVLRKHG
jgi:OHCU decarboxylase